MEWALMMVWTVHGMFGIQEAEIRDMGHFTTWKECHVEELKHEELHDTVWCRQVAKRLPPPLKPRWMNGILAIPATSHEKMELI